MQGPPGRDVDVQPNNERSQEMAKLSSSTKGVSMMNTISALHNDLLSTDDKVKLNAVKQLSSISTEAVGDDAVLLGMAVRVTELVPLLAQLAVDEESGTQVRRLHVPPLSGVVSCATACCPSCPCA